MYYTRSLLFVIYSRLIIVTGATVPVANGQVRRDNPIYDRSCPDGLPGRVTQIQQQSLTDPAIFITDCSTFRNNIFSNPNPFEISTLDKRQEQICPADCSNQCSGGGGLSTSDCANLSNQLNNRNTQFTVSGFQTISMTYGTCMFQLVNQNSSPFIYCDTSWASRSTSVVNSCQSSGGLCQGSRFQAVVAVNNLAPSPTTTAPAPAQTTQNNSATTNQGGNTGASTNGNGSTTSPGVNASGNASNSNTVSGNTAGSNTVSSSAPSGALPNTLNGAQSGVSGSYTTTMPNGSVLVLPTVSFGLGGSGGSGNQSSSINVPAIVGAILGILFLLVLIILLLLWRRKRRVQSRLANHEAGLPARESSIARTIDDDARLQAVPALGSESGADVSETPMTETIAGAPLWVTSNKVRMHAEEATPRTSDADMSSIEPSAYTTLNNLSDSPAPVYRRRSSRSRRETDRGGRGHRRGSSGRGGSRDHPNLHSQQQTGDSLVCRDRDAYASDGYSTVTGSSNSMSARTFAQAAAPTLSPGDIDRLAESIVARMQGRDPALRERVAEDVSVITEDDEPPPPWSAPGSNVHRV